MSDYPTNSTAKVYHDCEGNELTLYQMVRREPDWAMSRIRAGEEAIKDLEKLRIAQAVCPHVVTSGTTSWCRLAQSSQAQNSDGEAVIVQAAAKMIVDAWHGRMTMELRDALDYLAGSVKDEEYAAPQPAVNQQLLEALVGLRAVISETRGEPAREAVEIADAAIAAAQEHSK